MDVADSGKWLYLIALGSNVRHHRYGLPARVLQAALRTLGDSGVEIRQVSPVLRNPAMGPSLRQYANAAAVVRTNMTPPALLAVLKQIERDFGRNRGGRRWSARVLDLDIVLWSGGAWASSGLTVPHIAFRERDFVLGPAAAIAPLWRDPISGFTLQQLHSRLTRRDALPIGGHATGP